jgi:succinate dehydrogenase/fumarate reductase flavoprotein subunit
MKVNRRGMLIGATASLAAVRGAQAALPSQRWSQEVDVVVVGAGAAGFTTAIVAREAGASVALLEVQPHIGGHAIISGGNVALGGGTSQQQHYGIEDSPDLLFRDLTDWAAVNTNGVSDYRYNDREIVRAYADHSAPTFEWLKAHGVVFVDRAPDPNGGISVGNSAPREHHAAPMDWLIVQSGRRAPPEARTSTSSGAGLMWPLDAAARKAGVQILLEHRMVELLREQPRSGRITGVMARHDGRDVTIRARKAVMLATGGSTGNVNFRRMIDPRLTEEYCGLAGLPWSDQDASGELAAMAIGASLWGLAGQAGEYGWTLTKAGRIGTQHGYGNVTWTPECAVFDRVRATGLRVRDWQNVVLVNMLGARFHDETAAGYPYDNYGTIKDHVPYAASSAVPRDYRAANFLNAALAGFADGHNGGGPIWALFDADAAAREGWNCNPPWVDTKAGFFFQADTLRELAARILMPYQRRPMPPAALEATVTRYNGFVDAGRDTDFGKPAPKFRIERPPFYAAWSTPVVHDTRSGLRIDARCRVLDLEGELIPGLYSGGETAGGFSAHGLARALCQGYIAGRDIATLRT